MSSSVSIVEYFSENSGSSCGYCKGKDSSFSHGLWGHVLRPSDYQDMIDRGWRRSGKYCYKPTMNKTTCWPQCGRLGHALEHGCGRGRRTADV